MCFDDAWVWPSGDNYLFPDRTAKSHMKKDAVCHAITKARKSFGKCAVINPEKIRSYSGRHTMINTLKMMWECVSVVSPTNVHMICMGN